ncbi:MAG: short-chain dehydrogenase [Sandaracinus sp.]|nr:short-chain dehydrogenase [Sandaracinus sp.]|tara:strand:+ start:788 stop:1573 length:786 start_codon:yes stop_codon:yes gene_type:complete
MGRFDGKVAWITGGGSGIGKALALEFAREGAAVAVSGRRVERIEEVAQEIEAAGGRGLAVPCDVTEDGACAQAVDTIVRELGRLDVAVANAGFGVAGKVTELDVAAWKRQFDVNVFGLVATLQAAVPALRETDGRVALLGSVMAMVTVPGNGPYAASKYAVRAIGQTLSMELHGTGMSCTLLHPGFVESEIGQVDNQGRHHADRKDPRPAKLMWPADKAAKSCVRAIHARKREHVFTAHGKVAAFLGRHTPSLLHLAATRS